jgi:hypothetical protein
MGGWIWLRQLAEDLRHARRITLATELPAQRATRIDPVRSLRPE